MLTHMVTNFADSPVKITAVDAPGQPDPTPELESLYRRFEEELLVPLWTEIGDLMPRQPVPAAVPHVWRWRDGLLPLARQAGQLVPVGRGGERRAIALANPGLARRAVCDTDSVGGDPVSGAARGGARAPAYPERLPVRGGG